MASSSSASVRSDEAEPLLSSASSMRSSDARGKVDQLATGMILIGLALFVGCTMWMVWVEQKDPLGNLWFSLHPTFQSLGIAAVVLAIWGLQPTTTSQPKEKAQAFTAHRTLILSLALPSFLIGATAMIYNKYSHSAAHFTTWHGLFGLLTLGWLFVQSLVGLVVSTPPLYNVLGGKAKAKKLFKHHRASGYVLLPAMLGTAHLGEGWSDWAVGNTGKVVRVLGGWVGLGVVLVGVMLRVRGSKMAFFS